ncbi:GNAT family N-acetyltransferase [Streptomyces litmocidini]|uniref:GNAT family N-acetyltransferase n=1 Tax=Streptomyces litmocidini TaxID=67318 RepID=UPI0036F542DB
MTTSSAPSATGLRIRPLAGPEELVLFPRLTYSFDHELADDLAAGRRPPSWRWVALDAHGRADPASGPSAREAAEAHYDEELALHSSPRAWWRVAELPGSGEPAGFVVPARNDHHVIAYLGVLPAHRGHGYVDDILAEGTRIPAATGVPRIRAVTDLGNVPMAASFARAGRVTFGRAVDHVWDAPGASGP